MPFVFIAFLYASSVLVTLLLAGLVYWRDPKAKANRYFFLFNLTVLGWLVSLFVFHNADSNELVLWTGRANFAVVLLLLYFLFEFELVFPTETVRLPRIWRWILQIWIFGFFFVTLLTPLVDKNEIIIGPLIRETVYGPLFFLYSLNYLFFGGGGVYVILRKLKNIRGRIEKYQLGYFVAGLAGSLSFAFVTNILLYSLGIEQAAHWGVLAPVFFAGFTTYAIFKYYLFDIKLILTEVLIATIAFMLLSQIFFAEHLWLRLANTLVFGLFCLFGYLLVHGVLREIRLREQLAVTNTRLRELDAAKTEFVSLASHQLRTPLSAIKGFLSLLIEGMYGAVPQPFQEVLQKIYVSNERLILLVRDLLDISR